MSVERRDASWRGRTRSAWIPSGFFVLRTPYLPVTELLALSDGLEAIGTFKAATRQTAATRQEAAPAELEAALARDRALVRERLRLRCRRGDVREALFLASPAFADRLECWAREPPAAGNRGARVELTLLRYLTRMAARSTPFGLFAGYSLGTRGPRTRLTLPPPHSYRRRTRLDCHYLDALCEALADDPALRWTLTYRPNSSLYEAAGRVRYVLRRRAADGGVTHRLTAVRSTPALRTVLGSAADGARPGRLAAAICDADPEITMAAATAFVAELIECGLLVPDLTPAVAGTEPLADLLRQLEQLDQLDQRGQLADQPAAVAAIAGRLRRLDAAVTALDAHPPGAELAPYRPVHAAALNVTHAVTALTGRPVPVEPSRVLNVSLEKPAAAATLSDDVLAEIAHGAELLHRIRDASAPDPLARFRDAFRDRYGEREVPLGTALDEEAGIGFPVPDVPGLVAPLLTGLRPSAAVPDGQAQPGGHTGQPDGPPNADRQALLLRWLSDALRTGADEIVLGPAELAALAATGGDSSSPLPDAFSVLATIVAESAQAVAAGRYRIMLSKLGGPSGAGLLGRFCHGDPLLTRHVRAHLRAEEALRPDAVFAEIVHLPSGRLGNIVSRPALRDHEIAYLGRSGAAPRARIPLSDLVVCVHDERVILRSRRLGREIEPRLTSAHNFADPANLGVYRFLCCLQRQGVTGTLSFSFGGPLRTAPYLPRVTSGRLILSRARWNVTGEQLRPLSAPRAAARFAAAQALRERLGLPRWVAIADGDNLLPIDLDNILHIDVAARLLGSRSAATLVETFCGPDEVLVDGPDGRFVHELVVPFVRAERPAPPAPAPVRPASAASGSGSAAVRAYPPGSEWLYAKLYTGTAGADAVLDRLVRPLVRRALAGGLADGWFFVRYGDPDWHLRLRLHGDPRRLLGEVQPDLLAAAAPLVAAGLVRRIQLDTYEPELERYGGPAGMALAERLFQADSECALDIVALTPGDQGADVRWRLALAGIDSLLADLGLDLSAKRALVTAARDRFRREFRAGEDLVHKIGARYRVERASVEQVLPVRDGTATDPAMATDSAIATALAAYTARSCVQRVIAADLAAAAESGRLAKPVQALATGYMHMHVNRVLRAGARAHELVLYDFLSRFYTSQQARLDDRHRRGS
jgi:thiopeptide-type bacteriocin biosynthesis protein